MNLTDKIRDGVYVLVGSLALASPLYNAYAGETTDAPKDKTQYAQKAEESTQRQAIPQTRETLEKKLGSSLDDFKKILGKDRLSKIDDYRLQKMTEIWPTLSENYRKNLIQIYSGSGEFYEGLSEEQKKEYDNLSKEIKEQNGERKKFLDKKEKTFGDVFTSAIVEAIYEGFKQDFPWVVNYDNFSDEDLKSMYAATLEERRKEKEAKEKKEAELKGLLKAFSE